MLRKEPLAIITVIIFLIPVVIFIPTLVGESQSETTENTYILEEGDTEEIGQYIEFTVVAISGSDSEITIVDSDNGETNSATINESESHTFTFENGDIVVELVEIHTTDRAVYHVEYPQTYGWDDSEKSINDYLPIMVIISIVMVILGVLLGVIGGDD